MFGASGSVLCALLCQGGAEAASGIGEVLAGSGVAQAAGAAEAPPTQLALRTLGPPRDGRVVVDRGDRDGLTLGDTVTFQPRAGGEVTGIVRSLDDQRASVELLLRETALPAGTRGFVLVQRQLAGAATGTAPDGTAEPAAPNTTPRTAPHAGPPSGARPPSNPGHGPDGWTSDMPLLANIGAVRPESRAPRLTGRVWTTFDSIFGADGARSDSFFRTGTDLTLENPFGAGGALSFDGEVTARETRLGDDAGGGEESAAGFRLNRFAYEVGGSRFDSERWTFGRFVSRELPEVGVQDGVEWSRRLDNGHRFGVSAAFLPEPDQHLDGSSDIGLTGWYRWVADTRELTTVTAGVHKTVHEGKSDRDLFLLKAQHLPQEGWTFLGSAWIDLHAGDDLDDGLALTEAYTSIGRRFEGQHDLRLTYQHREYPELLRDEFPPVGVESLTDGRLDRLSLGGAMTLDGDRRLTGRVGTWSDERDAGGDGELGVELRDVLLPGGRLRLTAFAAQGKYSTLRGARVALGRSEGRFAWELMYEAQQDLFEGFETINDDARQHRLRATTDFFTRAGLNLSVYGELQLQDIEDAYLFGFHLGKSF